MADSPARTRVSRAAARLRPGRQRHAAPSSCGAPPSGASRCLRPGPPGLDGTGWVAAALLAYRGACGSRPRSPPHALRGLRAGAAIGCPRDRDRSIRPAARTRSWPTRRPRPSSDISVVDGIPVTSVARTLLDCAPRLGRRGTEKLVAEAEHADLRPGGDPSAPRSCSRPPRPRHPARRDRRCGRRPGPDRVGARGCPAARVPRDRASTGATRGRLDDGSLRPSRFPLAQLSA